jgi:hypothetical protein
MDRAIAIAYGGEEVFPKECKHSDFYDLGIRCPSCLEIVKYVDGYQGLKMVNRKKFEPVSVTSSDNPSCNAARITALVLSTGRCGSSP